MSFKISGCVSLYLFDEKSKRSLYTAFANNNLSANDFLRRFMVHFYTQHLHCKWLQYLKCTNKIANENKNLMLFARYKKDVIISDLNIVYRVKIKRELV